MSISYGFYDSYEGDRKYNTRQLSSIFDGIILDGVFMTIGEQLRVKIDPTNPNGVLVGTGRAWFNHTWTLNDGDLAVHCGAASNAGSRYDAVVLEVNEQTRENSILVINGEVDSKKPPKPSLEPDANPDLIHRYALCYIYRPMSTIAITAGAIENVVGTSETPFVSGPLKGIDMDALLGQWRAQLDEFVASEIADMDEHNQAIEDDFDKWYADRKTDMSNAMAYEQEWEANQHASFESWFATIQTTLSGDVAGNLASMINAADVERMLVSGLAAGTKTFSIDGTTITTIDPTTGFKLVKTFTNDYLTSTSVLTDADGGEVGTLIKNFSADGSIISSTMTNRYRVSE